MRTPLKYEGEPKCSEKVGSSCSTSGTCRVNLVTNPVISHEWVKDLEVLQGNISVLICDTDSTGFTYRLDMLKSRASKFRGPPANLYNTFVTVIGLSYLCCHNAMYSLSNPSVIIP